MDPLEFRLKNLKDERLRAVFEAAAKQFGWGKSKTAGQGFGMGGGYEKLGNIATFAEVNVDRKSGDVKVVRVVSAFECGAIVNPDGLRNQIEGSNMQGLGGALFEAIEFDNGKILNGTIVAISRAAVQRCAGSGNCSARSQGYSVGGRGRVPDDRTGARNCQCDLRRSRSAVALAAVGSRRAKDDLSTMLHFRASLSLT